MTEEIKEEVQEESAPETSVEETAQAAEESEEAALVREELEAANSLHEKRGRMVVAGIVATVALSVIALLVAGIFQLTSKWLIVCPTDLPINDPAKELWQDVTAEKIVSKGLGVPEKLAADASFKVAPVPAAEPSADAGRK